MSKFKEIAKQMWNVPNMFTMLRVFCVPVFLFFLLYGGLKGIDAYVYTALGVFVFASATDLFDGMVARKFNMVTDLGKVLDPLADKIMHVSVILGLTIIGYVHWAFIVAIVLKEFLMVLGGIVLVKHKVIIMANMIGKVASATLSAGVILSFFHPYVYYVDWGIIGLAVVLTYIAFFNYLSTVFKDLHKITHGKASSAEEAEALAEQEKNKNDGNE